MERKGKQNMSVTIGKRMFPCPVCTDPREVRITKKDKPYITCDPCGIQVFVRGPAGIAAFNRLVDKGDREDLWTRLRRMERRYRLRCHECGSHFWIEPDQIKTSMLDGSLKGFRCPGNGCSAIVPWEEEE
jgi:transcription elongation factor Elf1